MSIYNNLSIKVDLYEGARDALQDDSRYDVMSCFFFSSRRRHTRCSRDWSSDVCSSDLPHPPAISGQPGAGWGEGTSSRLTADGRWVRVPTSIRASSRGLVYLTALAIR